MILHRFCSNEEFARYKAGETLINVTDHYRNGRGGSISKGFCFFSGDPEKWARRLHGLVDFDVLLTVSVKPKTLTRSQGFYADWDNAEGDTEPRKLFTEYCTTSYNGKKCKFVSADFSWGALYTSKSALIKLFMCN